MANPNQTLPHGSLQPSPDFNRRFQPDTQPRHNSGYLPQQMDPNPELRHQYDQSRQYSGHWPQFPSLNQSLPHGYMHQGMNAMRGRQSSSGAGSAHSLAYGKNQGEINYPAYGNIQHDARSQQLDSHSKSYNKSQAISSSQQFQPTYPASVHSPEHGFSGPGNHAKLLDGPNKCQWSGSPGIHDPYQNSPMERGSGSRHMHPQDDFAFQQRIHEAQLRKWRQQDEHKQQRALHVDKLFNDNPDLIQQALKAGALYTTEQGGFVPADPSYNSSFDDWLIDTVKRRDVMKIGRNHHEMALPRLAAENSPMLSETQAMPGMTPNTSLDEVSIDSPLDMMEEDQPPPNFTNYMNPIFHDKHTQHQLQLSHLAANKLSDQLISKENTTDLIACSQSHSSIQKQHPSVQEVMNPQYEMDLNNGRDLPSVLEMHNEMHPHNGLVLRNGLNPQNEMGHQNGMDAQGEIGHQNGMDTQGEIGHQNGMDTQGEMCPTPPASLMVPYDNKQTNVSNIPASVQTQNAIKRPFEPGNYIIPGQSVSQSPQAKRARIVESEPPKDDFLVREASVQLPSLISKFHVAIGILHTKIKCFSLPNHGTVSKKSKIIPEIPVTLQDTGDATKLFFSVVDGQNKQFGNLSGPAGRFLRRMLEEFPLNFNLKHLRSKLRARVNSNEEAPGHNFEEVLNLDIHIITQHCIAHRVLQLVRKEGLKLSPPVDLKIPHFDSADFGAKDGKTEILGYDDVFLDQLDESTNKMEELALSFPTIPQSERIKTPLLKHQRQALWFMEEREKFPFVDNVDDRLNLWRYTETENGEALYRHKILDQQTSTLPDAFRGGIICDEMGLGKTLTLISLVVSTAEAATAFSTHPERIKGKIPPCRATLVVVKTSILDGTWVKEIKLHVPGMKFCKFYGNDRPVDFGDHEIVLTTYETLAREYSKHKLSSNPNYQAAASPLFAHEFYRIILDECHFIRNPSNLNFNACLNVHAKRRWGSTGTPLQNKVQDLGALVTFLRVPFLEKSNMFESHLAKPIMAGDLVAVRGLRLLLGSISIRRTKQSALPTELVPKEETTIRVPFDAQDREFYDRMMAKYRRIFNKIKEVDHLAQQTRFCIFNWVLKLRQFAAHKREMLSPSDLQDYTLLAEEQKQPSSEQHASDDDDEGDSDEKVDVKQLAIKVFKEEHDVEEAFCFKCTRQIKPAEHNNDDSGTESEGEEQNEGPILFHTPKNCWRLICDDCLDEFRSTARYIHGRSYYCDPCEKAHVMNIITVTQNDWKEYLEDQEAKKLAARRGLAQAYTGPSSKVRYLVKNLESFAEWDIRNPKQEPIKSIVFSEWTSHLDLIALALEENKIKYVRLDGSLNSSKRGMVIQKFEDERDIKVFLISIKAGGFGLNLTMANYVFLMEPNYNPMTESQAIDRVHRIGQRRAVKVVRIITENTIEDNVRRIAQRKAKLAELLVSKDGVKVAKEEQKIMMDEIKAMFKWKLTDEEKDKVENEAETDGITGTV